MIRMSRRTRSQDSGRPRVWQEAKWLEEPKGLKSRHGQEAEEALNAKRHGSCSSCIKAILKETA